MKNILNLSRYILITLIALVLIPSCSDDSFDYDCTDCTFFVCEVDGKEWTPSCEGGTIGFGCSAVDAQYYNFGPKNIYLYIQNDEKGENIHLFGKNIENINTEYSLVINENIHSRFATGNQAQGCKEFFADTTSFDKLILSELDTINFLVAGNFAFTGYNDCGDKVKITNGKFRLNYRF